MAAGMLQLANARIDPTTRVVWLSNQTTARLTPNELMLLRYFLDHPDRTITRQELLVEVWGYSERVVSRTADVSVHRLRQKVQDGEGTPAQIVTEHRVGYRFQSTNRESSARLATYPLADAFVGRRSALDDLERALDPAGWTTVVGPGGVGKTRLLREHVEARRHAWCSLAAARETSDALAAVSTALDCDPVPEAIALALDTPKGRLVVLDNCEQLTPTARRALAELFLERDQTMVVATSREPLHVPRERVFRLGPLAPEDAVALFMLRAQAVNTGFASSPEISGLVARLDHIPLAIELAATRVSIMTPAQLLERLGDRFRLLGGGTDALRATIDWSWGLLTKPVQHALVQISTFVGSFGLEAAEAVIQTEADDIWALDLLQELVDKSLVQAEASAPGVLRYRLYESVRDFALQQDLRVLESARERHAEYYGCLVPGDLEATDRSEGRNLKTILLDVDNVIAAAHHALAMDQADLVRSTGQSAVLLMVFRGWWTAADALATRILQRIPDHSNVVLLRADIARERQDSVQVESLTREALAMARSQADRMTEARALWCLAARTPFAPTEDQLELLKQARPLLRAQGHLVFEAKCLSLGGFLRMSLGRLEDAKRELEEAISLLREAGSRWSLAQAANTLSRVHYRLGQFADSTMIAAEVQQIAIEMGDRIVEADAVYLLAVVALARGDLAAARQHLEHLAGLQLGNRRYAIVSLAYLDALETGEDEPLAHACITTLDAREVTRAHLLHGTHLLASGRLDDAATRLESGLELASRKGWRLLESHLASALAEAKARQGKTHEVQALLATARASWEQSRHEINRLHELAHRAQVHLAQKDPTSAKKHQRELVRSCEQLGIGPASPLGREMERLDSAFGLFAPAPEL